MSFQENVRFPNSLRLVAKDLRCERGERLLFSNLSFSVAAGSALTVIGANGAGKSSLLRILAGFLRTQVGDIRLEGLSAESEPRHSIHYLGHRDGLRAALTARENLAFACASLGPGDLASDALAQVGLPQVADMPVGLLSAGQRRRVALARLMVSKRPVWLLDEPTAALDHASQGRIADLLTAHLREGGLAVVASHLPMGIESETLALDQPS